MDDYFQMTTNLHASFQREIFADFAADSGLLILGRGMGLLQLVKAFIELYSSPKLLVFLLGASEEENVLFQSMFTGGKDQLANLVPFRIIKNDTPAHLRLEAYLQGGVISVTSRIMLTDLLKEKLPMHMATGLMIMGAHCVTEYSLDAFIIELFRSGNGEAFIKTFSDKPEAFVGGISKTEKCMKYLQVSRLILFPRFHALVKEELDGVGLGVEELLIGTTQRMRMIQFSLMEIMQTCLSDLIRVNPSLDVKEFNIESAVTQNFDQQIRRQLDPIWHRVSLKSRQLVTELRLLRELLTSLIDFDAISFCRFIETILIADMAASGHGGFRSYWLMLDAAQVVIRLAQERVYSVSKTGELIKNVEVMPKAKILEKTLKDLITGDGVPQPRQSSDKKILIMTSDEHTKKQLTAMLSTSFDTWIDRKYKNFISWKKSSRKFLGISDGLSVAGTIIPHSRKRTFHNSSAATVATKATAAVGDEIEPILVGDDEVLPEGSSLPANLLIESYQSQIDPLGLLHHHNPTHILMYDYDLGFLRTVELHGHYLTAATKTQRRENGPKVMTFTYKDSIDEQLQLLSIRQEKEAFESLIRTRSTTGVMNVTPVTTEVDKDSFRDVTSGTLRKFTGASSKDSAFSRKIIVDLRELRSSLPFILYKHGFTLEPLTIEVGDYILTRDICVERKSTSDLISSLNSGRLLTQAEQMCRRYQVPILLIEFDDNKPFSLLPVLELRQEISISDTSSKICLLLLHFPQLKILWSSSLAATADMFADLRRGDESEPVAIGIEESNSSSVIDPVVKDILLSMPGVNHLNYHNITRHVRDLRHLAKLSKDSIEDLIGAENGSKLYNFLHQPLHLQK